MNTLRNSVRLFGNVGQDPEIKTLENGNKLAKFSLATTEKFRDSKGEITEETTWHNLVVWGKQADTIEKYVKKGEKLLIEGRLTNRSYEAKDGTKKYITEIVVNEFLFAGLPKNKLNNEENVVAESDLPF
ncbi:MAG: single-stranded DNA-binding protein [Bacteroidetes bacterium]|nr:single-stranded DNA-binding protein [Bacteroidota bacterium]